MNLSSQLAQVGLIAAAAGLIGAIAGALIGAVGSWIVARSSRRGAREARLHESLLAIAAELVTRGARHTQDVANQLRARQERAEERPRDTGGLPGLHDTDGLEDLCNKLYLVANKKTADAAVAFYEGLVAFGASYAFSTARHVQDGVMTCLAPNEMEQFEKDRIQLIATKTAFMDEVRDELGHKRLIGSKQ